MCNSRTPETAARPPDLGGLARGRRDDHPQVWRAPRDSRAYISTPPPALLRLLLYFARTTSQVPAPPRRAVPLKSRAVPIDAHDSCPRRPIASATNTWLLPREVGPSSDMEDRVPQSRAKPRVTPLVTISDWRYLLRRHHVTTPALWAGRLPHKGFCPRIDRKSPLGHSGIDRLVELRRDPALDRLL
jgi:hypothetical protein